MDFRKNVGSPFQESPRDGRTIDCLLVAAAPDVHLLRVGDELLAEVGMRDADERLGTLPGRKALEPLPISSFTVNSWRSICASVRRSIPISH